jgi:hypothetical protein
MVNFCLLGVELPPHKQFLWGGKILFYILFYGEEKKNQEINCEREKEKFKTYLSGDRGRS